MIFAAEETTATTTTYANTRWKGPFCTVEPNTEMMPATMRIFDFYLMRGNKIFYNWMIIDTVDLMLQAGRRVLPKVNISLLDNAPKLSSWVCYPKENILKMRGKIQVCLF